MIDANRGADFKRPASNHAPVILRSIADRRVRVAVGGRLLRELVRVSELANLLTEWGRIGQLKRISDEEVDAAEAVFGTRAEVTSDDPHVLGLAEVAGARLLYTADHALMNDFTNREVLKDPRGKVIGLQTQSHSVRRLLNTHGS